MPKIIWFALILLLAAGVPAAAAEEPAGTVAAPSGPVRHVLGAAPGHKRTFGDNLRHERLHIRWDEDPGFREKSEKQWAALSDDQKAQARRQLPQYPAEAQLIEEWAVGLAEKNTK